jgi:hypothetical protein
MIKITKPKQEATMTDKRIAELQNFKTTDFTDCPVQTREQLRSLDRSWCRRVEPRQLITPGGRNSRLS